jgi:hypothetical protein
MLCACIAAEGNLGKVNDQIHPAARSPTQPTYKRWNKQQHLLLRQGLLIAANRFIAS